MIPANGANYKIAKKVFDLIAPDAIQIGNAPKWIKYQQRGWIDAFRIDSRLSQIT